MSFEANQYLRESQTDLTKINKFLQILLQTYHLHWKHPADKVWRTTRKTSGWVCLLLPLP